MSNYEVRLFRRTERGNPVISPYAVNITTYTRVKRELSSDTGNSNGNGNRNGTSRHQVTVVEKDKEIVIEMKTYEVSGSKYLRLLAIMEENTNYDGVIRRRK